MLPETVKVYASIHTDLFFSLPAKQISVAACSLC